MMKWNWMKSSLMGALVLFILTPTSAQDIHFTQFKMAPLTVNPAFAGAFSGTYRLGGIYRDQWSSFSTPSFYVDSPITKGLKKEDWIGVGGVFVSDNARVADSNEGDPGGIIRRTGFLGTAAYHLSLDKKQTKIFSVGVKVGTVGFNLENNFRCESDIRGEPGRCNVRQSSGNNDNGPSFLDISAGLMYSATVPKTNTYYRFGFSVNHIAAQSVSLTSLFASQMGGGSGGRGNDDQNMLIAVHGDLGFDLNDDLLFDGGLLGQFLGSAREIAVQGRVGYRVPEKETIVYGGLGYRLGDAAAFLLGLDYKKIRVGLAYDLNLSSLTNPNSAFELAVSYVGIIYKKPKVDPVIFCPKF